MLESLRAPLFREQNCFFGGGTAIALRFGEVRESLDIDFLVSDLAGYRALRTLAGEGLDKLFVAPQTVLRAPRMDQYGIRFALDVDGVPLKFEIVLEGRIRLAAAEAGDEVCGVSSLSKTDLVATKLLANSDRWADDSMMSRDLVDLATVAPNGDLPLAAVEKAEAAYGPSVRDDLAKAVRHLLDRPGRLRVCIDAMAVDLSEAVLRDRIANLRVGR